MPTIPDEEKVLEAGRIIDVRFQFALPAAATKKDILDWVAYELEKSSISMENPLFDHDLEAFREPVLADTGMILRVDERKDPSRPGVTIIRRWAEKA